MALRLKSQFGLVEDAQFSGLCKCQIRPAVSIEISDGNGAGSCSGQTLLACLTQSLRRAEEIETYRFCPEFPKLPSEKPSKPCVIHSSS